MKKSKNRIAKRMYFFVPYNISDIQKGIQCGHAVEQYAKKYKEDEEYIDYLENDKTWIILNGGTTNNSFELGSGKAIGTLNQIVETLKNNDIKHATFQEPDLNNALTAVCFLAEEMVWDYELYPDVFNIEEYIGEKNFILRDLIRDCKLA